MIEKNIILDTNAMKKIKWICQHITFTVLLLQSTIIFSASTTPHTVPLQTHIDYLAIHMPDHQPSLGIVGLHILHPFQSPFYAGFGIYSAATGQYNGFFSMGLDAGVQHRFSHYFGIDAGVYTGASGGHGLGGDQIGDGGLMIAHAGLLIYLKHIQMSISDSYAKFLEGEKIASHQLLLAIDFPFHLCSFRHWSDIPTHFKASGTESYIGIPISAYIPQNAYFADGTAVTETMGIVGVEFGQMIHGPFYYYAGVENAVSGTTIGFSIVKGGIEFLNPIPLSYPFFSILRLGILSAGGNSVNSGGGLSGESQSGVGVYVTPKISLRWLAGYLSAFAGRYHDITTSIAVDYHFSILSSPGDTLFSASDVTPKHFRIRLGNQTYFTTEHYVGAASVIHAFNAKIDDVLSTHWFLTGQGSFSYAGIPGCYATGLLGAGYQWAVKKRWLLYISAMGGGGSGGATSLGQGVLLQGSLGALYQLTPSTGVYTAFSKAHVIQSTFAPWVLDAGLFFNLNFLTSIKNA